MSSSISGLPNYSVFACNHDAAQKIRARSIKTALRKRWTYVHMLWNVEIKLLMSYAIRRELFRLQDEVISIMQIATALGRIFVTRTNFFELRSFIIPPAVYANSKVTTKLIS